MARRKNQLVPVEVLPPEARLPAVLPTSVEEMQRYVQLQVAELLSRREDAIVEPFFRARRVAQEFKRLQSIPEQKKWTVYFQKFGCLNCHKKDRLYGSSGMCHECRLRVGRRLSEIVRELRGEKPLPVPRACEVCGQKFLPLTEAQWENICYRHERGQRHQRALRIRRSQ